VVPHADKKVHFSHLGNQQMAGVKGRSGGPRKNSGGTRAGAGRKPKAGAAAKSANAGGRGKPKEPPPLPVTDEPLTFLLAVQNDKNIDIRQRVRAAIAAAQYKHTKRSDGGKRDEAADRAKKAGAGKFAPPRAPKLVVNNR
jgi:phage terminase small subunit